MNPKLWKRIKRAVESNGRKYGWHQKVQARMLKEIREDAIIPMLGLHTNSCIALDTTADAVRVAIGRRDFEFEASTGFCVGAGTLL